MLLIEATPLVRLYCYEYRDKANKTPDRDLPANQIYAFFDPDSKDYIGYLNPSENPHGARIPYGRRQRNDGGKAQKTFGRVEKIRRKVP